MGIKSLRFSVRMSAICELLERCSLMRTVLKFQALYFSQVLFIFYFIVTHLYFKD